MNKEAITKNNKGITIHLNISHEMVFTHAMAISAAWEEINMEIILSHPVGAVPLSMFHEDDQIHKNQKSNLGVKLEMSVVLWTELPPFSKQNSVVIRDAMSIVQRIDGNTYSSFSKLGDAYLDHLLKDHTLEIQWLMCLIDMMICLSKLEKDCNEQQQVGMNVKNKIR